jgi:hypothetical protein
MHWMGFSNTGWGSQNEPNFWRVCSLLEFRGEELAPWVSRTGESRKVWTGNCRLGPLVDLLIHSLFNCVWHLLCTSLKGYKTQDLSLSKKLSRVWVGENIAGCEEGIWITTLEQVITYS